MVRKNEEEKTIMIGPFSNNAAKHVWSEYKRLMTSAKRDMTVEDFLSENKYDTKFLFLGSTDD